MKKSLIIVLLGALAVWFVALSIHYASASEHWKITAIVRNHANPDEWVRTVYGKQETGPIYFDSEAACKKEIADKKSTFNVTTWLKMLAVVKQTGDVLEAPVCVLDLAVPKKNEL